MSPPVAFHDLTVRAAALCKRDMRNWAAMAEPSAVIELPLHPPTERDALADLGATREWIESWRNAAAAYPIEVTWEARRWARVGRQDVAVRVRTEGVDAVVALAALAFPELAQEWAAMRSRCLDLWCALAPLSGETGAVTDAIRRHAGAIATLPAADFEVLDGVVAWIAANPTSGRRVRSLPIRGIDTKWLERHKAIVSSLVAAVTGHVGLGLVGAPVRVRVRALDPTLSIGDLRDVAAPVEELGALRITPNTVLITENLETMLELPDLEGAIAIHGAGFAVDAVTALPWVRASRTVYWGDLDSQGFAILNRARAAGLVVESLLMDEETLMSHRDLWVPEPVPATGEYAHLTPSESATLTALRANGNVRLEQERIPWGRVLEALYAVLDR